MNELYHNRANCATGGHGSRRRTRPATWVPRRVYYVLAYLKRQLASGNPQAISNKRTQDAIRFGSEGEVSQIMRWLAGEAPTKGRWSYGVLNTPQVYRFIVRELHDFVNRVEDGGGTLAVLPDVLAGHRLAGIAADHDVVEAGLAKLGANPLLVGAFRKRRRSAA